MALFEWWKAYKKTVWQDDYYICGQYSTCTGVNKLQNGAFIHMYNWIKSHIQLETLTQM